MIASAASATRPRTAGDSMRAPWRSPRPGSDRTCRRCRRHDEQSSRGEAHARSPIDPSSHHEPWSRPLTATKTPDATCGCCQEAHPVASQQVVSQKRDGLCRGVPLPTTCGDMTPRAVPSSLVWVEEVRVQLLEPDRVLRGYSQVDLVHQVHESLAINQDDGFLDSLNILLGFVTER